MIACMLPALLQVLLLAAAHANTSFKDLLDASHLFSNMQMYSHVVHSRINELLWNYEFIIMKIYFQWELELVAKILYYKSLEPYSR